MRVGKCKDQTCVDSFEVFFLSFASITAINFLIWSWFSVEESLWAIYGPVVLGILLASLVTYIAVRRDKKKPKQ